MPQRSTSAVSVMLGHTKARIPNTIAATPRITIQPQFWASWVIIVPIAMATSLVAAHFDPLRPRRAGGGAVTRAHGAVVGPRHGGRRTSTPPLKKADCVAAAPAGKLIWLAGSGGWSADSPLGCSRYPWHRNVNPLR